MVCNSRIWQLGLYFFKEDNVAVTINSERYCVLLDTFLRPRLDELDNRNNVWFQQDSVKAHTSGHSMEILREMFPGHLISLCIGICWPVQSPDLNSYDFFSLGIPKIKGIHSSPLIYQRIKRCYLSRNCCYST